MSLLNYRDFLNESIINESSAGDQLISMFTNFRKTLSSQREKELLAFASNNLATELGANFTGLINNDNFLNLFLFAKLNKI